MLPIFLHFIGISSLGSIHLMTCGSSRPSDTFEPPAGGTLAIFYLTVPGLPFDLNSVR